MHRLLLGGAKVHQAGYICPPCQLRISLSHSHPTQPFLRRLNQYQTRLFSNRTALRQSSSDCTGATPTQPAQHHTLPPQPDGAPSNPELGKDEDQSGGTKAKKRNARRKKKVTVLKESKVYMDLLHQHEKLHSKLSALSNVRGDDGSLPEKDRESVQNRVESLEQSLSQALKSTFSADSKYQQSLQNFARGVSRVREVLKILASSHPKSATLRKVKAVHTSKTPKLSSAEKAAARNSATARRRRGKLQVRRVLSDDKETKSQSSHSTEELKVSKHFTRDEDMAKPDFPDELTRHGLSTLAIEEQLPILRLVGKLQNLHAAADLASTRIREHMLAEASAVFNDQKVAESIVNMACERIANQQSETSKIPEGIPIGKHERHMSLAQALGGAKRPDSEATGTSRLPPLKPKDVKEMTSALLESSKIQLCPIEVEQAPVRGLSYGLDRVLFNPGVYRLQDLRSRVYNFDPYLEELIPVQDFNFDLLPGFITSSKDTKLLEIARRSNSKYTGSSSSMTRVLSHFHFLLSRFRKLNLQMLSRSFPLQDHHYEFTEITKAPASIFLRLKDEGVYAIDTDKEDASTNVLSLLGHSLEKLLTLDKSDYVKYRRDSTETIPEEKRNAPETYHYTTLGNVLLRSQLDAHDSRLPGTGMFDLKTRAIWPIRMDVQNYQLGRDYEIKTQYGRFESYEREYLDMLRATMIKYMLQVRIGRMDGIYVAWHNTQRIFGLQYIPLEEIDLALHGQYDRSLGDQEFNLSVKLMSEVMDKATETFPNSSIRLLFRTGGGKTKTHMYIFAEPATEEEADKIQNSKAQQIAAVEKEIKEGKFAQYDEEGRRIYDYSFLSEETASIDESDIATSPDDTGESVENPAEISSPSITNADDTSIETEETSQSSDNDPELAEQASAEDEAAAKMVESGAPLLAMELKIDNFRNGLPVDRPGFPDKLSGSPEESCERQALVSDEFSSVNGDEWSVQYTLREVTNRHKAWLYYLRAQKAKAGDSTAKGADIDAGLAKIRRLGEEWSQKGKAWRTQRDEEERASGKEKVVANDA